VLSAGGEADREASEAGWDAVVAPQVQGNVRHAAPSGGSGHQDCSELAWPQIRGDDTPLFTASRGSAINAKFNATFEHLNS